MAVSLKISYYDISWASRNHCNIGIVLYRHKVLFLFFFCLNLVSTSTHTNYELTLLWRVIVINFSIMRILRNPDEINYVYTTPWLYLAANYATIQALSLRGLHKLREQSLCLSSPWELPESLTDMGPLSCRPRQIHILHTWQIFDQKPFNRKQHR